MSNTTASRARTPNFTREDQQILLDVMQAHLKIVECKKNDNVKLSQKADAWKKITSAYNAKTKNVSRSVGNLIGCYRNMKTRMKKHNLETTINLRGGGPPADNEKNPLKKLKLYTEPQIDGPYSIYDEDADLAKDFQMTLPKEERLTPIEMVVSDPLENVVLESVSNVETHEIPSPLETPGKYDKPTRKSCNEAFQSLTEAKSALVRLQTELVSIEISHKKKLQELEIKDIIKENKFKEEMRQKKLMLLDLEIKRNSD